MNEIIVFKVNAVNPFQSDTEQTRYVVLGDWFGESEWHNEIAEKLDTPNWISYSDHCAIVGEWTSPNYAQGVRECEIKVSKVLHAWVVNSQNYNEIISIIKEN